LRGDEVAVRIQQVDYRFVKRVFEFLLLYCIFYLAHD